MTAAIWSTAPNSCSLNFPALTLIRFMHNHHLLQISDRPQWLTIKKGGKIYIDSVMEKVKPENVHLSTPVTQVERRVGKVAVTFSGGEEEFDHVIFATHADTCPAALRVWPVANPPTRAISADECASSWEQADPFHAAAA